MATTEQKREEARAQLRAFFEKDESLVAKVAFVGMTRPMVIAGLSSTVAR